MSGSGSISPGGGPGGVVRGVVRSVRMCRPRCGVCGALEGELEDSPGCPESVVWSCNLRYFRVKNGTEISRTRTYSHLLPIPVVCVVAGPPVSNLRSVQLLCSPTAVNEPATAIMALGSYLFSIQPFHRPNLQQRTKTVRTSNRAELSPRTSSLARAAPQDPRMWAGRLLRVDRPLAVPVSTGLGGRTWYHVLRK